MALISQAAAAAAEAVFTETVQKPQCGFIASASNSKQTSDEPLSFLDVTEDTPLFYFKVRKTQCTHTTFRSLDSSTSKKEKSSVLF